MYPTVMIALPILKAIFTVPELGISIINIASGENLLADYDQSMFESWNSGITIDPDRRVFYCHDGEYAYCIKIPDDL
jgi:hypothetical protein